MRLVLDANVLVSALLSRSGAPAQLVARGVAGEFELVVSEALLAELGRALRYPRVRERVPGTEAAAFVALLRDVALVAADPPSPPRRSADPGDDYLLALAEGERALLVSGDRHLLDLAPQLPVETARAALDRLDR